MKLILIVSGIFATSAFAGLENVSNPSINEFQKLEETILSLGDQTVKCINLAGTWKGYCQDKATAQAQGNDPTQKEISMTFEQKGCSIIQAAEFGPAVIGAVRSESISSAKGVLSKTGSSWWEDNGTKVGMAARFSLVTFGEKGSIYSGDVHGKFALEDSALVGNVTHKIIRKDMKGQVVADVGKESNCRLTRQ